MDDGWLFIAYEYFICITENSKEAGACCEQILLIDPVPLNGAFGKRGAQRADHWLMIGNIRKK